MITKEEAESVTEYKDYARLTLIGLVLIIVPFCSISTTVLPTWLFINTLQLVAHLPLFNAHLPPFVHSLLLELLSFLRFDWAASLVGSDLGDQSDLGRANDGEISFDEVRLACGYTDKYVEFALFIMAVVIAISIMALTLMMLLARFHYQSSCAYKCLSWVTNMTVRITCIFLLELLVSICVTLVSSDEPMTDLQSNNGLAAAFSSIFLLVLIILLLTSLLCGCGIGSQTTVSGLYLKNTFWRSCFEQQPMLDKVRLLELVMEDEELLKFAMQ